jgi:hypothetical protein
MDAPMAGVGADDDQVGTFVPDTGQIITPHNSFLYLGLAGGIIPLAFYVAYWFQAFKGGYRFTRRGVQDAAFQLPLLGYTFVAAFLGASDFMLQWATITLCNAMPRSPLYRVRALNLLASDGGESKTIEEWAKDMKAGYALRIKRGVRHTGYNR